MVKKIIIMKKILYNLSCILFVVPVALISCTDDENPSASIVKEWSIPLSTQNENAIIAGRTETGTVTIQLMSDNSINYTISVTGLASGDALTNAHIHTGDVVTNGPVILGFDPAFTGGNASGTIPNVRGTFVDSLKNNANELYFNVHSTQVPAGLVRGQLNIGVDMAATVALSGTNQVPPVTTTATGIALLRLTSDKKLYSKVTVNNLEATDALRFAHIHKAAAGTNGPVIIDLCATAADFGVTKVATLDDASIASFKTETVYVNAHSVDHPGGVVRGQIR
jgi:hypothetical protein